MKNKKKPEPVTVPFNIKVDELLKFKSQVSNNEAVACRDIFRSGKYYFLFTYNRSGSVRTNTLREITSDEYYAKKAEFLSFRPEKGRFNWSDGKNNYELKNFSNNTWYKDVRADDCIFLTETNPLKIQYDKVTSEASARRRKDEEDELEKKRLYAKTCGILSKKMGIAYQNVARIGPDAEKLRQFQESYQRALVAVRQMSLTQQHQIFNCLRKTNNREEKRSAIEALQIQCFDADVKLLNFQELEEIIAPKLEAYVKQSLKIAIDHCINLSYEQRCQLYERMETPSRDKKRSILTELGVEAGALDISDYPFYSLKIALASTIGIEQER